MLQSRRLRVADLNPSLICALCSGYLIDATTIIECLHSFCRSCIVKYLQSNKYCPICDVQVHKTKPLLNIRPDQMLQDIVYKLVPGLFQNEMRRRREWYARRGETTPSRESQEELGPVCLSLEYEGEGRDIGRRRFLRCPPAVSVQHLHKLLRAKYGLSHQHRVDVMYAGEPLRPDLTLADIAYIYLWRTKAPLHLTYRIFEVVKCSVKKDTVLEETDEDAQLPSAETWKEVQLQISENGIMSVTNIADTPPPAVDQLNNNVLDKPALLKVPPVEQETEQPEERLHDNTSTTELSADTVADQPDLQSTNSTTDCISSESTTQEVKQSTQIEKMPETQVDPVIKRQADESPEENAKQPPAKQAKQDEAPVDISKVKVVNKKIHEGDTVTTVVKNVQQLSSNHPLKIHSQQIVRQSHKSETPASGLQYSRVSIVPRRTAASPGYKTLRDPPRAWNPQLPPRPQLQPQPSGAPAKPAKFFKVRNNMPRYLGNPASGVKPMYQLGPPPSQPAATAAELASHQRPTTPRPHMAAVTRVDPKTLRPLPPQPSTPMIVPELKINQSTVPILNPLRDKGKPDRRSSPKSSLNQVHANGAQPTPPAPPPKKDKPQLSFTPTNPFVPNLGSPNLAAPNHFLYGAGATYFPHLSPGLYYQQRYAAAAAAQARSPRSPSGAVPPMAASHVPSSSPPAQQPGPPDPKLTAA